MRAIDDTCDASVDIVHGSTEHSENTLPAIWAYTTHTRRFDFSRAELFTGSLLPITCMYIEHHRFRSSSPRRNTRNTRMKSAVERFRIANRVGIQPIDFLDRGGTRRPSRPEHRTQCINKTACTVACVCHAVRMFEALRDGFIVIRRCARGR